MSRQRERRSFTVEVKSSTRQGASITIPSRVQAASRSEPAAPRSASWDVFAPRPAAAPAAAEPPRVLPSLLLADAPATEDEPAPALAAELPPPRVRRVKRAVKAPLRKQEPGALVVRPVMETVAEAEPARGPSTTSPPSAAAEPGMASKRRLAEAPVLRRGERWKRRLPRSCW